MRWGKEDLLVLGTPSAPPPLWAWDQDNIDHTRACGRATALLLTWGGGDGAAYFRGAEITRMIFNSRRSSRRPRKLEDARSSTLITPIRRLGDYSCVIILRDRNFITPAIAEIRSFLFNATRLANANVGSSRSTESTRVIFMLMVVRPRYALANDRDFRVTLIAPHPGSGRDEFTSGRVNVECARPEEFSGRRTKIDRQRERGREKESKTGRKIEETTHPPPDGQPG